MPMDPIKCAEVGDLEYFKTVDLGVLCKATTIDNDNDDNGVLTTAVRKGHLDCCEEILKRCSALLYHRNRSGYTALHSAALNGKVMFIKLLLNASSIDMENRQEDNFLTVASYCKKKTALHLAVQENELESAKLLIEADPSYKLLKMVDKVGDTALHIAVKNHNLEMVKFLSEADSSSCYSAQASGHIHTHTPVWIAFQEALTGDHTSVEIRKLLITKYPSECKVRIGANNWTILHHVVCKGDLGTVEDIFRYSPDCLDLVNDEGQNFLHLAIKFHHVNIVEYSVGITTLPAGVLNGQDNYGNTPLHIAAIGGQASMALPLLYDPRVNKKIVNKQGNLAIDMITCDFDKRKAGVHGFTEKLSEKEIKDQSDFDLVVGALIATVSFTVGITVPGGYIADGPNKGTTVLANKFSFKVFAVANTFALLLSLYAVFSHFCAKRLARVEHVIYQLNVATYCSLGAIFALVVAFIAGSYAVLAVTYEFAILVCVLCCCFFLFASQALWRMVMGNRPSLHRSGNCCCFV